MEDKELLHEEPEIILSGAKSDLLGLTEPAHMCSNCWIAKSGVDITDPGNG